MSSFRNEPPIRHHGRRTADQPNPEPRAPSPEPRNYNPPVDAPASHRADAPASVRAFVLTISDTRSEATDTSGAAIVEALTAAGHTIAGRKILRDDPAPVTSAVRGATVSADVIITTGGTGITSRDSTFEAIAQLFEKRLDGFGELFRMLSYQQIGAAAMLSRACAGTIRQDDRVHAARIGESRPAGDGETASCPKSATSSGN